MSNIDNCRIIELPKISDPRGSLTFIEANKHVPFNIERTYYLYDVPGGAQRGGHAHKALHQLISAVSGSFDVVLTNHVIEHVGDEQAQRAHLAELYRVLRPDGVGYLAVPNRWMLVEPHYRLAFLSWWPHAWRTPYLRVMRKGEVYDCEPLQMRQLEHMLDDARFSYRNLCVDALRLTFEIERPDSMGARFLRKTSGRLLKPLHRIIPTLIYRFSR